MFKRPIVVFLLGFALILAACAPVDPATPAAPTDAPTEAVTEAPTEEPAAEPTEAPTVDPALQQPPAATLTIAGQSQTAAIGTYCWSYAGGGLCVDKIGIPSPDQPLPAGQPVQGTLEIPVDAPVTNVTMGIFAADEALKSDFDVDMEGVIFWDFPEAIGAEQQVIELQPQAQQAFEVALEPGVYVIHFFVGWEGIGDATYGFLVEVK
jgi:hypothetical protein